MIESQHGANDLSGLLAPAPEGLLEMRPVSPPVNSVKKEGEELLSQVSQNASSPSWHSNSQTVTGSPSEAGAGYRNHHQR